LIRSGRCFTLEELERKKKEKGKAVEELTRNDEVTKPINKKEVIRFLKLMKHNEYNVME
jgi:hypothetical protein